MTSADLITRIDAGEFVTTGDRDEDASLSVEYQPTTLVLPEDMTFGEWLSTGETLKRMEKSVQWWIGDWLRFGARKYGEMYTQALEGTRYSYSALTKMKWVAEQIPICNRLQNVGWTHHLQVAPLMQSAPAQAEQILHKAATEELSVNEIRDEVRRAQALISIAEHAPKNGTAAPTSTSVIQGDMLDVIAGGMIGPFDLVIADPPYNVTDQEWDQRGTDEEFLTDTRIWLTAVKSVLKPQYNLFWFCWPGYAADIELLMRELRLPVQSRIVWHRRNMATRSHARTKFIDTWEMVLHCSTRPLNFPITWDEGWFDVQTFASPQSNYTDRSMHPTQKPLGLIQRLVEYGSYPGDAVLDPFAGSGTTGAACGPDRDCTLIELGAENVELINARLSL